MALSKPRRPSGHPAISQPTGLTPTWAAVCAGERDSQLPAPTGLNTLAPEATGNSAKPAGDSSPDLSRAPESDVYPKIAPTGGRGALRVVYLPLTQSRAAPHFTRPRSSTQVHSLWLTLARDLDLHDGEGDPFPVTGWSGPPRRLLPCHPEAHSSAAPGGFSGTSLLCFSKDLEAKVLLSLPPAAWVHFV